VGTVPRHGGKGGRKRELPNRAPVGHATDKKSGKERTVTMGRKPIRVGVGGGSTYQQKTVVKKKKKKGRREDEPIMGGGGGKMVQEIVGGGGTGASRKRPERGGGRSKSAKGRSKLRSNMTKDPEKNESHGTEHQETVRERAKRWKV